MSLNYHLIDTRTILLFSLSLLLQTDNLELEASCNLIPSYLDTSTPLDKNSRCSTGICRTVDEKCGCTIDDHCSSSELCHIDNKCYSSGLGYEDDCSADNGDDVDARCTSGKCRSTDNKCGCTSNSHCPSDKVCKTSTKECVTQQYRLSANCDLLGRSGEGTTSQVSLNVKRDGWTVVDGWIPNMDKTSGNCPSNQVCNSVNCPDHTFELAGAEPDEYEIKNHGSDELGVSYFKLDDVTNGGEIRRWGSADDNEGWCLSNDAYAYCFYSIVGARHPRQGIRLHKNGTVDLIKFSGGKPCNSNQVCSSSSCVFGGGSCGILNECCSPVSSLSCFITIILKISYGLTFFYQPGSAAWRYPSSHRGNKIKE